MANAVAAEVININFVLKIVYYFWFENYENCNIGWSKFIVKDDFVVKKLKSLMKFILDLFIFNNLKK